MAKINIQILGQIDNPPQIKTSQDGKQFMSFSVVVKNHARTQSGEPFETQQWFYISSSLLNNNLINYLTKGTNVFINGHLSVRAYTNQKGEKALALNIWAYTIDITSSAPINPLYSPNPQQMQQPPQPQQPQQAYSPQPQPNQNFQPQDDPDLPF